ncbi:MAG: low temperature requirement protein A [Okeania sp. SIO3B3]|nr:low temperature requirement protein A [Okeania sp. SIO3B3]
MGCVFFSIFGLIALSSLWWVYFDDVAGADINWGRLRNYLWFYGHLPVALGLTAFGVAAKKLYSSSTAEPLKIEYIYLYAGAVIMYLVGVALIDLVTPRPSEPKASSMRRVIYRIASAVAVLLLAYFGYGMFLLPFIVLMAVFTATPVIIEVVFGTGIAPSDHWHTSATSVKPGE